MELTRASGILLHPTALPSSYGVGDFGKTAYEFADFLCEAGQSFWQLLPLGHTSYGDSPYQCQSSYAGNPLLICPEKLAEKGFLDEPPEPFPDADNIDYGEVIPYKYAIFEKAYIGFKRIGNRKLKADFTAFYRENKRWLHDYCFFAAYKEYLINERKNNGKEEEMAEYAALFPENTEESLVADCYYGASWNSWPEAVKKREKNALREISRIIGDRLNFYAFLQFIFDMQWNELKNYVNKKGIKIIGDIPIFVALDSADVWAEPGLFLFDANGFPTDVAGVPPDYFSETGQLWGNPLYDWKKHAKTDYSWWKNRIEYGAKLFDMIRIDHFRGFEAYWSIPASEKTAENGRWIKGPGKAFFDELKKSLGELPIIAEDLGIITPAVEKLRDFFKFPGMKILQYGFDDDRSNSNKPHNFKSSNVVVYTGTHDNDTTLGWYNSIDEKSKDLFRRYMNTGADEPSWDLIRLAGLSNALLAIFPVQDILGLDTLARFNTPGKEEGNWRWRMKKGELNNAVAARLRYITELGDRLPFSRED